MAKRPPPKAPYAPRAPKVAVLSQRERTLAHNIVTGMKLQDAMLDAGYTHAMATSGAGAKIQRRPGFQEEVARIRAGMARRLNITLDSLVLDLLADREAARTAEQPATAATITMSIAKLLGFLSEKSQLDITIINKPLATPGSDYLMSVEDWIAEWSPKEITHG
jgi:hypothetical protein